MNRLKLWLSDNTDYRFCYKCQHFTRNPKNAKFNNSTILKWLKPSYWKHVSDKLNTKKEGYCAITIVDETGDHQHLIMRGNEQCIFEGSEEYIKNTKEFTERDKIRNKNESE
jgi:hypothetical protein